MSHNTTQKMIKYLEDRVNCAGIAKFISKHSDKNIEVLQIDGTNVSLVKKKYNGDDKKSYTEKLFNVYDFMTESNYTGFEYFPYLYGVLNCYDEENDNGIVYTFSEVFDGDLMELFKNITHVSEWYDIIFQIASICLHINKDHKLKHNGSISSYLYRKIKTPYTKKYSIDDKTIYVKHNYKIVLWDIDYLDANNSDLINLKSFQEFINLNQDSLPIKPSQRIINFMTELIDDPTKSNETILKFYGAHENQS